MKKIKWDAKAEYEYVMNYKILQDVFDKHKINKNIEIAKLIKAKPLDNIEFLQWLKKFYETHVTNINYDALSRRNVINPQGISGITKINEKNTKNLKKQECNGDKNNFNEHSDNKLNMPIRYYG